MHQYLLAEAFQLYLQNATACWVLFMAKKIKNLDGYTAGYNTTAPLSIGGRTCMCYCNIAWNFMQVSIAIIQPINIIGACIVCHVNFKKMYLILK